MNSLTQYPPNLLIVSYLVSYNSFNRSIIPAEISFLALFFLKMIKTNFVLSIQINTKDKKALA
jgi:hypothetical protein